jgi:hypothetical protein
MEKENVVRNETLWEKLCYFTSGKKATKRIVDVVKKKH